MRTILLASDNQVTSKSTGSIGGLRIGGRRAPHLSLSSALFWIMVSSSSSFLLLAARKHQRSSTVATAWISRHVSSRSTTPLQHSKRRLQLEDQQQRILAFSSPVQIGGCSLFGGSCSSHSRSLGSSADVHHQQRSFSSLSGSKSKDDESRNSSNNKKKQVKNRPKSKKFTINESAGGPESADKLAAAFDEFARKEGFDPSMSYFADDATFEEEFGDDDMDENDEDALADDDEDDNDDAVMFFDDDDENDDEHDNKKLQKKRLEAKVDERDDDDEFSLDPSQFDLSHFISENDLMIDNKDHQSLAKPGQRVRSGGANTAAASSTPGGAAGGSNSISTGSDNDMKARMAAAKRGIPLFDDETDDYRNDIDDNDESNVVVPVPDFRLLGFRREANPFGNDETPRQRREQFQLITDAMACSACGSDFQSHNDQQPGYLPPEKFAIQVKLHKIQEMQRLQEKATSKDAEWTTDDEIEWLLQTSGKAKKPDDGLDNAPLDIESMAEAAGLDLIALSKKRVICKRCHGLQNFGKVEDSLRPGWSQEPLLAQEKFRNLLRPIRDKRAVIIALVDLFDFAGSVLPELDAIAGENNPVILAANKVDLLPSKMGTMRAENWVRRELEYLGVKSLGNAGGGAVRLISCKTGLGIQSMMSKAQQLADEIDGDIYVIGAANAGKSTLLNQILSPPSSSTSDKPMKRRAGNSNARKGAITTSPLPGTTLQFIKVELEGGRNLYDTPGLLVPGTLTQLLTPEELKIVVPTKKVEPITFRVAAGKCVLVGGLARIELVDSKPFFFTFFVANDIKLHPTDASRADDFVRNHAGGMLTPPLAPGPERLEQLGEFEEHVIDIQGRGWQEAAADITLTGLGWVAVTGAGTAKVRVSVPKGIGVVVRPPLMPFDVWEVTAKYTGARAVRKSTRTASGKRRKGVGRQ